MLTFYGIRFNKQGAPERFNISFDLRESLNAGLYIYDSLQRSQERSIQAVEQEINNLFRGNRASKSSNRLFRLNVAKWFRTRDIVKFICPEQVNDPDYALRIARVLNTPESIEDKWRVIEEILLSYLRGIPVQEKENALAKPESELNLTLQMVRLFFLEQDEEMPPANLEMQFVRGHFPKVIWKKKDGFSASSNPFWIPKTPYCSSSYLLTRLISTLSTPGISTEADASAALSQTIAEPAEQSNAVSTGLSFRHLYPEAEPDETRIEFDTSDASKEQLSLLPETAAETLLSLQKMAQSLYSHDGVRHLLGIFRQIAMNSAGHACEFDVQKHFNLVTRVSRSGKCSEKQQSIFWGVFGLLRKLNVKRFWRNRPDAKIVSNPFILELGAETSPTTCHQPKKKLLLDPIFAPSKHNPFQLGRHLALIPEPLFRENLQKHPLLPGLLSFISGTWLNAYPRDKGTVQFTTRDLVTGGAFNVSRANRYRFPAKIESEVAYLKEKCYISDYTILKDSAGNPWNDNHRISAPKSVIEGIESAIRLIRNQPVERLIA